MAGNKPANRDIVSPFPNHFSHYQSCPKLPLPALQNPTVSTLSDPAWVAINTIVDEAIVRQIIPRLKAAHAQGIVEYPLNKIVL